MPPLLTTMALPPPPLYETRHSPRHRRGQRRRVHPHLAKHRSQRSRWVGQASPEWNGGDLDGRTESSLEETGNATFLASSTPGGRSGGAPSSSTTLQIGSPRSMLDGTLPSTSSVTPLEQVDAARPRPQCLASLAGHAPTTHPSTPGCAARLTDKQNKTADQKTSDARPRNLDPFYVTDERFDLVFHIPLPSCLIANL
jgi:hypothetical protein